MWLSLSLSLCIATYVPRSAAPTVPCRRLLTQSLCKAIVAAHSTAPIRAILLHSKVPARAQTWTSTSTAVILHVVHEQNRGPDDIANRGHRHGVAATLDYFPLSHALWEASRVDALEEAPFRRVEESENF